MSWWFFYDGKGSGCRACRSRIIPLFSGNSHTRIEVVGVFSPDACLIVKEGIIDLGLCKPGQRFFIQHVFSFCKKSYRVSHDFDRAGFFLCIIEFMRFHRHSVHSLKSQAACSEVSKSLTSSFFLFPALPLRLLLSSSL